MTKLKKLILDQIKQGATPQQLALAIAVGLAWGLFPVPCTTTLLCLASGHLLKLNHPILQAVNYLMSAVQILMMPIWVRLGETILSATHVPLSPSAMIADFKNGPLQFFARYGLAEAHAVLAWLLIAPAACGVAYFVFIKLTKAGALRQQ